MRRLAIALSAALAVYGCMTDTTDNSTLPATQYDAPIIPDLPGEIVDSMKAIRERGRSAGMRADVFMKIGDSITARRSFLFDIGDGNYDVAYHTDLAPVIERFRKTDVGGGLNSFNRVSMSAVDGWGAEDAVDKSLSQCAGITPVECEAEAVKPAFAIVMLGTNNVGHNYEEFKTSLDRVVKILVDKGVVPIVSTIPDALWDLGDEVEVPKYNETIIEIANRHKTPVLNYWMAMLHLPNLGLSEDLVHPSVAPEGPGVFTDAALEYGYNMRAHTFLKTLKKILEKLGE